MVVLLLQKTKDQEMNKKKDRAAVIAEIAAAHPSLGFDHFHYHGRDKRSVFYCKKCQKHFRQSVESLLQKRRLKKNTSTACACRIDLVNSWDLPEKHTEEGK